MQNEETSIEASVLQRMIKERINPNSENGSYSFEDIIRYKAEEVCNRLSIPLTEDLFQGFLAASKLQTAREKNE